MFLPAERVRRLERKEVDAERISARKHFLASSGKKLLYAGLGSVQATVAGGSRSFFGSM
jgi:hypothetical protein